MKYCFLLFLLLCLSFAGAEGIDFYLSGSQTRDASVDFTENSVYYGIQLDSAGLISSVSISKNGLKENAVTMVRVTRDNNKFVLIFQQSDSRNSEVRFSAGEAGRIDIEEMHGKSSKIDTITRRVDYSFNEDKNELCISEGTSRINAVSGRTVEFTHTDFDYTFREFFSGKTFAENSQIATKWEYFRNNSGMIIAQEYWNYDVVPPGGSFYSGTRSGYKGGSLSSKEPLILVMNYLILDQIFGRNTIYLFGHSLFNIPVCQGQ